jgi:hypothetical protein
LACKVLGLKKIKVFNADMLNDESIWETEANSINFFEDVHDNFRLEMNVKIEEQKINIIFVNGSEQFTIAMNMVT